jgi:hypothetical protein
MEASAAADAVTVKGGLLSANRRIGVEFMCSDTEAAAALHPAVRILRDIGALRLMLGVLVLMAVIFAPSPDVETQRSGWGLVATGVVPALGPIIFFVVLFDMLMSRVLMSDATAAGRRRYRLALMYDGALALVLLLSWLPFLLALLEQT